MTIFMNIHVVDVELSTLLADGTEYKSNREDISI